METVRKIGVGFVMLAIFLIGLANTAYAMPQIVPSSADGDCVYEVRNSNGDVISTEYGVCGYCDLLVLADNIIGFIIMLAILIAVAMIIYAGFLYLTGAANQGQISKAKSVLRSAVIGFIIVLAAWLIVDLIVTAFFSDEILTDLGGSWGDLPGCSG